MDEAAVRYLGARLIDDDGNLQTGDFDLWDDGRWTKADSSIDAVQTVDGHDRVLTRSLQNWHTHCGMTLNARDFSDGFPLHRWLNEVIFPTEKRLSEELVTTGTWAAVAEMIKTGSTFCADLYFHPEQTARIFSEGGVRAIVASPISEQELPSYPDGSEQAIQQTEALLQTTPPERTEYALGPHSVYLCSKETLETVAEVSREQDAKVHIHLSETRKEITDCHAEHGCHPTHLLERTGILEQGPICAHSSWMMKEEMRMLAKNGATAVHCPSSNMKLACGGTMSYPAMKEAGVDVRLGTDGSASSAFGLDLRAEARLASLVQRHDHWDPTLLPAKEAWGLATKGSQDWVAWSLDDVRMRPFGHDGHRLINHLIFSNTACLDVWVGGTAIRRDGVTLTLDEEKVAADLETKSIGYYEGLDTSAE